MTTSDISAKTLGPGDIAPDFELTDGTGKRVRLADLLGEPGRTRLVIFFYPKAFTAGCTTEACDFAARAAYLASLGAGVVGISRDEPERLADFAVEHGLDYPLLSDADRSVHRAYGVLGIKEVDGKQAEKVRRTTFVVGTDGRIKQAWYDVAPEGHAENVVKGLEGATPR